MFFSVVTDKYNHHHSQFGNISSPQKETPYLLVLPLYYCLLPVAYRPALSNHQTIVSINFSILDFLVNGII